MKKLSLLLLSTALLAFASCKKEVSPELEITVKNTDGSARGGVKVKISVDGANFGLVNAKGIDSTFTDGFGKAYFKFDNTILIDAAVYKDGIPVDSTSVLCETKRLKRKESNIYERSLTYY